MENLIGFLEEDPLVQSVTLANDNSFVTIIMNPHEISDTGDISNQELIDFEVNLNSYYSKNLGNLKLSVKIENYISENEVALLIAPVGEES